MTVRELAVYKETAGAGEYTKGREGKPLEKRTWGYQDYQDHRKKRLKEKGQRGFEYKAMGHRRDRNIRGESNSPGFYYFYVRQFMQFFFCFNLTSFPSLSLYWHPILPWG